MAKSSNNPEITKVINKAIKTGAWHIENGSRHGKLRHTSGRMVVYAATASDVRSSKNLERDIRHVELGLPGRGEPKMITNSISMKRMTSLAM